MSTFDNEVHQMRVMAAAISQAHAEGIEEGRALGRQEAMNEVQEMIREFCEKYNIKISIENQHLLISGYENAKYTMQFAAGSAPVISNN